ncbi:MAG: MATE family efflux transporter [Victivallales bacterium]|nr:MATE family efflux transporter [Victivallales bacterium]
MARQKQLIHDFTQGSIPMQLLAFSAPLFCSNFLQAIYNTVDMIVMGHVLGRVGLSSISVGGDIQKFLNFMAMGFSGAGQVVIAQFLGAGEKEKAQRFIGTMLTFMLTCAFSMSVLCLTFRHYLLDWLHAPPESREQALMYATTCMFGLVFTYGYNATSAIMRGMGDSKRPFMIIAFAAVLNLLLDMLFILKLGWGAFGAAFATVLAQATSFISASIYILLNHESLGVNLKLSYFRINRELLGPLVKLGVPMAFKSASLQFSKLFVNSWINTYGVVVSAVSGIGAKLNNVSNLIANSVNTAGSSMIGQNIGAEKYDRVSKVVHTAATINFCCALPLIIIVTCFPNALFGLFTNDAEVLAVCREYIPIAVIIFIGSALRSPMNAFINGSGNYRLNFWTAFFDGFVMRVCMTAFLGLCCGLKYRGFWLGAALAGLTPFCVGICYYLPGKWKRKSELLKGKNHI